MDFSCFWERIKNAENRIVFRGEIPKGANERMDHGMGHGSGKFLLGITAGMALGTAIGITVAPSQQQMRKATHTAAKKVGDAVDTLTNAMDM